MAMLRFEGCKTCKTEFITNHQFHHSVISSNPAMVFSKVDFPQPEGPTKTKKPPSSIERSIPFSTSTAPKLLYKIS